jgi:glycosyltransferase involved in cell wall biosynthesis
VALSPRQPKRHYHVDRIVRAFAASRLRKEGTLVIKLYGRKEEVDDHRRLEQLVRALGLGDAVRFAPACAYHELPGLYAMADVAISAVEVDGAPSTFCELLALGVPLIAADLPAYEGMLEPDERAVLVPPGDEAALAAAIDRIAADTALAGRLRERGMAWARKDADWRACVDRFEAMYHAAIAGRRAAAEATAGAAPATCRRGDRSAP